MKMTISSSRGSIQKAVLAAPPQANWPGEPLIWASRWSSSTEKPRPNPGAARRSFAEQARRCECGEILSAEVALINKRVDAFPHCMPVWGVWGVWAEDALRFSSAKNSRKARNLAHDPRAVMTTDDPLDPVVLDGLVRLVSEHEKIVQFAAWVDEKYQTKYGVEFFDTASNGCFRLSPTWAFALREGDFTGSPLSH